MEVAIFPKNEFALKKVSSDVSQILYSISQKFMADSEVSVSSSTKIENAESVTDSFNSNNSPSALNSSHLGAESSKEMFFTVQGMESSRNECESFPSDGDSLNKVVDVMKHKDKISILKQMSQVFNEEQPSVSDDSSASEDEIEDNDNKLLQHSLVANSNNDNKEVHFSDILMEEVKPKHSLKLQMKKFTVNKQVDMVVDKSLVASSELLSEVNESKLSSNHTETEFLCKELNFSEESPSSSEISSEKCDEPSILNCDSASNQTSQVSMKEKWSESFTKNDSDFPIEKCTIPSSSATCSKSSSVCSYDTISANSSVLESSESTNIENNVIEDDSNLSDNKCSLKLYCSNKLDNTWIHNKLEDQEVYHVPYTKKLTEEKVSVDSYISENGELVDIVDGFAFVSFHSNKKMMKHESKKTRKKKRCIGKNNSISTVTRIKIKPIKEIENSDVIYGEKLNTLVDPKFSEDSSEYKSSDDVVSILQTNTEDLKQIMNHSPVSVDTSHEILNSTHGERNLGGSVFAR